jgi:hypothetical protein
MARPRDSESLAGNLYPPHAGILFICNDGRNHLVAENQLLPFPHGTALKVVAI